MFGNIFNRGTETPPQPMSPTPSNPGHAGVQNPQPAAAQQQAPQQAPQQAQTQPAQQPAPQQPARIAMRDLLQQANGAGQNAQQPAANSAESFAANFIQAIVNAPQPLEQEARPSGIDVGAMRQHYSQIDMTNGIDMGALIQAIQQDPTQAAQAMQAAMNAQALNTMTAMAPLINQLVARAIEDATKQAVTLSNHEHTSSALVTAFTNNYPYAANPAIMPMVKGFAETIVQNSERGTPIKTMMENLDRVFKGIGVNASNHQQPNISQGLGITTDMSKIFSGQ